MKLWFTNADVLTQEKLQELKLRISQDAPDIIAVSEVRPKFWKHEITPAQYQIKGYNMEVNNLSEDVVSVKSVQTFRKKVG